MEKREHLVRLIFIFLCLQFILDFVYSRYTDPSSFTFYANIIRAIKIGFVGYLFFIIIKGGAIQKIGVYLIGLFGCFALGQWALQDEQFLLAKTDAIRELSLYLSSFIFIFFLAYMLPASTRIDKKFVRYTLFLINGVCLSVLIGYVFDVSFFRTYQIRFGFMGILHKSIAATYFFSCSVFFLYHLSSKKNKYLLSSFWLSILAAVLVGTKAIYASLLILLLYHIMKHGNYLKKRFFVYLIASVSLVTFFAFWGRSWLRTQFVVLYEVYEKHGFTTAFFSYRDLIFLDKSSYYLEHWNWMNYLFGGKNQTLGLFEMAGIDLFVLFGGVGMGVYLIGIYKSLRKIMEGFHDQISFWLLGCVLFISIFAGQLFDNFSSVVFIGWILYLMQGEIKNEN